MQNIIALFKWLMIKLQNCAFMATFPKILQIIRA